MSEPDASRPEVDPRGLRGRASAWRVALTPGAPWAGARGGVAALGITVPLACLLSAQTGISAVWLMVSSVVASGVMALFGGASGALGGPGVATAAAVAALSARHGPGGLALACAACGLLQVAAGALRLGRVVRLVPMPVVAAFASALGVWLLLLASPHLLGMAAPAPGTELSVLAALDHLLAGGAPAPLPALLVSGLACAATFAGRRLWPHLPVGLAVLALAAAATAAFPALPRLPDLPLAFSPPAGLALPAAQPAQFAGAVLVLWVLATAETLLSRAAAGEGRPSDPDRDLFGNGLANLAVAFTGGVPATAALVRGEAVRGAGSGGPAAGLVHALASALVLVALLAADRFVPMAALAGVVVAHALPLLSLGPWRAIARTARGQAAILAVTFLVMVGKGLIAGIELGLALSLLAVLRRVGGARVTVHRGVEGGAHQVTFSGPVTFLGSPRLQALGGELDALEPGGVILDLRDVPTMDFTGARRLTTLVAGLLDRGHRLALLGVSPACRALLVGADQRGLIEPRLAVTEAEVDQLLERPRSFELRAQVVASFDRFREEVRDRFTPLYQKLAEDQRPHTMFIGCVDSRVTPAALIGSHPGELFVVRCLGAIVVPPGGPVLGGEVAAVEYAVGVLGVRNLVVCGHSRCGAIRAISSGQAPAGLDSLARWLTTAAPAAGDLAAAPDLDQAARSATVRQLDNLRAIPQVRAALEAGTLRLHAWFYDVGRAELYEWRPESNDFVVLRAV